MAPRYPVQHAGKTIGNDIQVNKTVTALHPQKSQVLQPKRNVSAKPITSKSVGQSSPGVEFPILDFAKNAEEWKQSKKKKRSLSLNKNHIFTVNNLLTSMAVMLFIFGITVAVQSFMTNKRITAVAEASANDPESDVDESKPSADDMSNYTVAPHMPRYISLPKFDVTARVREVGLDKNGNLDAPTNIHDAAWYSDSALPGSPGGASIIDGHVSGPTQPGVFKHLDKLTAGDTIVIEKGDGTKIKYRVVKTEIANVDKVDMAKMLLPVTAGKHGLNLISCTGTYNAQTKQYEQRAMIFAEVM